MLKGDMQSNERREQAKGTWDHFDDQITDVLLRAVSGAFAMVACADGQLDESEIEIFLDLIEDTRAFAKVDPAAIERHFRDLGQAILADFEQGRRRALQAIAQVKGNSMHTALVVSAAQIAIVADAQSRSAEETALAQICEALGLDPSLY